MTPITIVRKLTKIGKLNGVSVPYEIVKYLNLKEGDLVKIKVKDWVFSKKLSKISNTLWIYLPSGLVEEYKLNKGDLIMIEILDVINKKDNSNEKNKDGGDVLWIKKKKYL